MTFAGVFRIFLITLVLTLVGNAIGFGVPPLEALPGMLILLVIVTIGYILSKNVPLRLPSIAYISALAIIASIPGVPGSQYVIQYVGRVQFLALTTPVLAYAGISIAKDMASFRKQGIKIVIVALLTFTGTFIGSAIIAQLVLQFLGSI